jgi:heme/copper-type cytochrome/quinol oxidase subunit 3
MLAASMVPLRAAVSSARRSDRGRTIALLVVSTSIQAVYLGVQIHLFVNSLAQFGPRQSAYASIYYVLLGAAHTHVAIGLLLDLWLLARFSSRLTHYRLVALEAVALYWAVVVGITVLVAITELSPRL